MADLHKMPGGAGFLKKQAEGQKTKEKRSVSATKNKSTIVCFDINMC